MNILLEIDANTFCISDTHFNHKGVFNFEPCRLENMLANGYSNTNESHTQWIIDNWNSVVKDDDIVIHLGDLAWKGHREIISKLNGRKILILGNHDKKGPNVYEQFDYVVRGNIKIENNLIYINSDEDKLLSTLEIKINNKKCLFSHYPGTVVEKRYKSENDNIYETPLNARIDKIIDLINYNQTQYNIHGHTHSVNYSRELGTLHNFINVSLEAINFKPCRLKDLLCNI